MVMLLNEYDLFQSIPSSSIPFYTGGRRRRAMSVDVLGLASDDTGYTSMAVPAQRPIQRHPSLISLMAFPGLPTIFEK